MTESNAPGKRGDATGRAFAGSQRHLQTWVNNRADELNAAVIDGLAIPPGEGSINWLSSIAANRFAEYRGGAILTALGLAAHRTALTQFWPKGGPVWDGLATVSAPGASEDVYLLVEAKSYPGEVYGSGCKATAPSRRTIEAALDAASAWLNVPRTPAWLGPLSVGESNSHSLLPPRARGCRR